MKKLVSLVLALLMMLSCVSFASAEGVIELDFWHSWGSGANYEALVKLVNDFNAANEGKIHVTETYVGNYAEVLSKVTVGYSANENPEINVIDACMTMTHAQNGVMENLSEYARANDPEYDMSTFLPGMLVFSTDGNGDVWSMPYARSTQIMYCNMDLIRDVMGADATAPKTWEELYAIAEAYKAKYDKPTYSHDIGGGYFAYYVTSMADGEYYNKAGTGACMNINDGWMTALNQWRKSIDNGWYMVPSLSTSGQWAEFKLGNLPISFASTGSLTGALKDCQFDLEVCFLPGYKRAISPLCNEKTLSAAWGDASVLLNGTERKIWGNDNGYWGMCNRPITYTFEEKKHISEFRLIVDSDLDREYVECNPKALYFSNPLFRRLDYNYTSFGFPKCMLKAFRIEALNDSNEWVTVWETNKNHQRMIREKLDVETTAIRLIPINNYFSEEMGPSAYGSSQAHIFAFEVRE